MKFLGFGAFRFQTFNNDIKGRALLVDAERLAQSHLLSSIPADLVSMMSLGATIHLPLC